MSKLTEQLREVGICNPHNFAGHGNVYIDYHPNDYGRGGRGARWVVARPGFKAYAEAPWYDYGCKTFLVSGSGSHTENKARKLEEAKQWASEKYGIKEWAKTPFGTWMDANFVKTRLAELKESIKIKTYVG